MHLLVSLFTGALSGWLAGKLMNSEHGLLVNIILGVAGGAVGGFLLNLLGIAAYSWLGNVLVAVIGACILIWIAKKI